MDFEEIINEINEKYYNKIKEAYGKYIKDFDKIPDMTKYVYIIPDEECVRDFEDLAFG